MKNEENELLSNSSPEDLFESLAQASKMRSGGLFMSPFGSVRGASAMMPQAPNSKPSEDTKAAFASAMKPIAPSGK